MQSDRLIEIILHSGYDVSEYENHYCVSTTIDLSIKVTVPKATYLCKPLVELIKKLLNIDWCLSKYVL